MPSPLTSPASQLPPLPLTAVVLHAIRLVNLANDVPVGLVVDGDEAVLLLELLLQIGPGPLEGEERLLDLGDQFRVEVVRMAVARGREGLRAVDGADF